MPEIEKPSEKRPLAKLRGLVRESCLTAVEKWGQRNWQTEKEVMSAIKWGIIGVSVATGLAVLLGQPEISADKLFSVPLKIVPLSVGLASVGAMEWAALKTFFVVKKRELNQSQ